MSTVSVSIPDHKVEAIWLANLHYASFGYKKLGLAIYMV